MTKLRSHFCLTIILCLVAISVYSLLFNKYRPAEIDDPWIASYVWNITHLDTTDDSVFGYPSNVRYFGHIHAKIVGPIADQFGWTKSTFYSINLICVILAAFAWFLVAYKLLGCKLKAFLFVLIIFLLEPFLGAAYKTRWDAMNFMLVSWGVAGAVHRRYFIGTLLISLAVEIHAISGVGYFLILAILISDFSKADYNLKSLRKPVLAVIAAASIGFIIYRYLHPEPLSEIFSYLNESNEATTKSFNALSSHYFQREYYRFIPELLFWFCGASLYFWQKKTLFKPQNTLITLFWATILASIVIHRGNFHYVIFFYPPIFLLALEGFWGSRLRWLGLGALVLYAIILSGAIYYKNRHVDNSSFDASIIRLFEDTGKINTTEPILGPANAWFPLRDRKIYCYKTALIKDVGAWPDKILYISSVYTDPLPDCARYTYQLGHSFIFNQSEVSLWEVDLNNCSKETE